MPDASSTTLIDAVENCLDRRLPDWDRNPIAVALSGGPDSTALFLAADRLCARRGVPLYPIHVNHGLRPEADAEAKDVAEMCGSRGRVCTVLRWQGEKPKTGLHSAARDARYAVMAEACRQRGVDTLLVAHHLEDQAETVLLRVDRDTGPDGLAGMATLVHRCGLRLVRPLLAQPKLALDAFVRSEGVAALQDPSNQDPRFARAELRDMAAPLAELGLTAERLGRLANLMGRARAEMDRMTADRVSNHVEILAAGYVRLCLATFRALPDLVARRVLSGVVQAVGGGIYPPRGDGLDRLAAWARTAQTGGVRTLGGCRLAVISAKSSARPPAVQTLQITREWRSADHVLAVQPGATALWDSRFEIANGSDRVITVHAAGEDGQRLWKGCVEGQKRGSGAKGSGASGWPGDARLALPCVVDLDGRMTLPHLSDVTADPFAWIGEKFRVRYAPLAVPDWLRPRRSDEDLRADPMPEPVNGRQAT